MKIRQGFVSNSSSCSFTIINNTQESLSLYDFACENIHLLVDYFERYGYDNDRLNENVLKEFLHSKEMNCIINPGSNKFIFGDEDGTLIGRVYDYMLRDGGKSKRFSWRLEELLR